MTDALLVVMDGSIVGTVVRLKGGRLRFDYADHDRDMAGTTPLSLSMPTQIRSHPDSVITPWLWGLLPDNDLVLARWGREFHVSASTPFSLLSTPIGEDCAGAVQFALPDQVDRVLARSGNVTWLTEDDVAERLRKLRQDSTAWLGTSFHRPVQPRRSPGKNRLALPGRALGCPFRIHAHHAHPQAGRRRFR